MLLVLLEELTKLLTTFKISYISCEENIPQTNSEQSTDHDEATVPTYEMISSPSREHVNIYDLINTDIQTGEQD